MQKVIRRTALARNQAKRKAIRAEKKEQREEWLTVSRQRASFDRIQHDIVRAERERRREDWMRGPLAPRRDVGTEAKQYGALPATVISQPPIPKHLRRRYFNIHPGDRVCVMKGKDKGKIDEVVRVNMETETVTLKTLNRANIYFPDFYMKAYKAPGNIQILPLPIAVDDVRLVVPLDDPDTGSSRDVIVEHVYGGEPIMEREWGTSTPKHTRYIAGLDIEIPWPRSQTLKQDDQAWDTLRMEVETPTWQPSLLEVPFPPSVMDEVRNKYSKYRTRHDPEWVEAKTLEDLRQEYFQSRTLLTPRGEFSMMMRAKKEEARKSSRDADGNLIMSPRTVGFIERFMKQNAKEES